MVLPCRLPAASYRASGLVPWRFWDMARLRMDFRFRWKSGRVADITAMTEVDPGCVENSYIGKM
jgi:hypothetical protein